VIGYISDADSRLFNGVFGREERNNIGERFCTFFLGPIPFTLYFN